MLKMTVITFISLCKAHKSIPSDVIIAAQIMSQKKIIDFGTFAIRATRVVVTYHGECCVFSLSL